MASYRRQYYMNPDMTSMADRQYFQGSGLRTPLAGNLPRLSDASSARYFSYHPLHIEPNTLVVAVCGVTAEDSAPHVDGWLISDFFLHKHLLAQKSDQQRWLIGKECQPAALLDHWSKPDLPAVYTHGNPAGTRKTVLDQASFEQDHTGTIGLCPEKDLTSMFLNELDGTCSRAAVNKQKIAILIFGHGDLMTTGIQLGLRTEPSAKTKLRYQKIEDILARHVVAGQMLTTSNLTSGWIVYPSVGCSQRPLNPFSSKSTLLNSFWAGHVLQHAQHMDANGGLAKMLSDPSAAFESIADRIGKDHSVHEISFKCEHDSDRQWLREYEERYAALPDFILPQNVDAAMGLASIFFHTPSVETNVAVNAATAAFGGTEWSFRSKVNNLAIDYISWQSSKQARSIATEEFSPLLQGSAESRYILQCWETLKYRTNKLLCAKGFAQAARISRESSLPDIFALDFYNFENFLTIDQRPGWLACYKAVRSSQLFPSPIAAVQGQNNNHAEKYLAAAILLSSSEVADWDTKFTDLWTIMTMICTRGFERWLGLESSVLRSDCEALSKSHQTELEKEDAQSAADITLSGTDRTALGRQRSPIRDGLEAAQSLMILSKRPVIGRPRQHGARKVSQRCHEAAQSLVTLSLGPVIGVLQNGAGHNLDPGDLPVLSQLRVTGESHDELHRVRTGRVRRPSRRSMSAQIERYSIRPTLARHVGEHASALFASDETEDIDDDRYNMGGALTNDANGKGKQPIVAI